MIHSPMLQYYVLNIIFVGHNIRIIPDFVLFSKTIEKILLQEVINLKLQIRIEWLEQVVISYMDSVLEPLNFNTSL